MRRIRVRVAQRAGADSTGRGAGASERLQGRRRRSGGGVCGRWSGNCLRLMSHPVLTSSTSWTPPTLGSVRTAALSEESGSFDKDKFAEVIEILDVSLYGSEAGTLSGEGSEELENVALRAFGWRMAGKYWKGSRHNHPPDVGLVRSSIEFLTSEVGLSQDQLLKVVKKFPEVVGLDVETLRQNRNKLSDQWKMKPVQVTKTVVRKPEVLGNVIDCEGDCKGDCTRCWAQF